MAFAPEEFAGPAQIEFLIRRNGGAMELEDLGDQLFRIEQLRGLVEAAVAFGLWLQDVPVLTRQGQLLAHRHLQELRLGNDQAALITLHSMAAQVIPIATAAGPYDPRVRFDFVGAYRLNPTGLRFLAHGLPYALVLLAGICGCSAAYKAGNAEACEMKVRESEREQYERLERFHRREGKWTKNLAESHARIVETSRLAAQECHVLFPDVEIQFSLAPRPSFEIRIRHPPVDSTDHPARGR